MKGVKRCIALLTLCIIFLLSLSQSLSASAITFTENLTKVGTIASGNWKCYWKRSDSSTVTELSSPCTIPALNGADAAAITRQVLYFQSNNSIEVKRGHIYEVKIYTRITQSTTAIDYPIPVIWSVAGSGAPQNLTLRQVNVDYEGLGTANSVTTFNNTPITYQYYPQQSVVYSIFLEALSNGTAQFKVGRADSGQFFNLPPTPSSSLYVPAFQIAPNANIFEYVPGSASDEAAEKELEDRDNLEDQQSSVDSDSQDSSDDATNTGTTLLAAFSGFVTALTSASPSNCNIDMDMGNLDLGLVNFCQLSPPQEFQALASIFLILFCVPLSIATARKVISLFRSFQN